MQISRDEIILIITVLAGTLLIVGLFFLSYITLYNQRKKRHYLQKIAMQKEFEQELVKTQMEVQEHTLQTIASDIHDNIGQLLSITKLTLSSIPASGLAEKDVRKLHTAQELLDNAAIELRQMASLLHAENILAKGLAGAVEREVNWLQKSERIHVTYEITGESLSLLPQQTALVAYRMIQEILNNAIKHAQATELIVKLSFVPTVLTIFISDNGKGFLVNQQKEEASGLGMKTLYHRASLIGADLRLDSSLEAGTTAFIVIPYQKQTAHAGNIR